MADTPRPWKIIESLEAQLSDVRVASGYRTDIGANVWTQPAQRKDDVLGISIGTESINRTSANERPLKRARGLVLVLEAEIAVTLDNAHELAHDVAEDLEVALTSFVSAQAQNPDPTQSLPLEVGDILILERPEGMPVIAVQCHVTARYWR